MRADAQKNYAHLLAVARDVITQQGADASLRDIARKADVGLGTLYRHFATRDALLEALLRERLDELTRSALELEKSTTPDDALRMWFRQGVVFSHTFGGVVAALATALADPDSALHEACTTMRSAAAQLLLRAQDDGTARRDIDGSDVLALIASMAWLSDQASFAPRADALIDMVVGSIFVDRP